MVARLCRCSFGPAENAAIKQSMNIKRYLGDSVYCQFDGFRWTLTTENGREASNTIIIEPEVLKALVEFIKRYDPKFQI